MSQNAKDQGKSARQGSTPHPVAERFWAKVDRSAGADGCWNWSGALCCGYGSFRINRKSYPASRIAWQLHTGKPIDHGLWVLHRCDNRLCCNPNHLFLGSRRDNINDMLAKGRQCRGEEKPSAKLTNDDLAKIRELINAGRLSQTEIGRQFGVNQSVISRIKGRKTWKHIYV